MTVRALMDVACRQKASTDSGWWRGWGWRRLIERAACRSEFRLFGEIAEQAVMADAHEAARQHVRQEGADEFAASSLSTLRRLPCA